MNTLAYVSTAEDTSAPITYFQNLKITKNVILSAAKNLAFSRT
jgi:hypothetical protein